MSQQLSSVNVALNASTAQYVVALKKAQNQTNKELKGIHLAFNKTTSSVSKKANALAGDLAGAFTISSVASLMSEMTELEREVKRSANAAGMATREYREFAFAAKTVGLDLDKVGSMLGDTEEKIGDYLGSGAGAFMGFVNVMQLTKKEARQVAEELQGLSSAKVLQAMVNKIQAAGKSTEEMNYALEGMASDARYLIPLLLDNGAELDRLKTLYRDTAVIIDDRAVIALNSAGTATTLLTENVKTWITNAATPAIEAWDDLALGAAKYFKKLDDRNKQSQTPEAKKAQKKLDAAKVLQREYEAEEKRLTQLNIAQQGRVKKTVNALKTVQEKLKAQKSTIIGIRNELQSIIVAPVEPPKERDPKNKKGSGGKSAQEIEAERQKAADAKALFEKRKTQMSTEAIHIRQQLELSATEDHVKRLRKQQAFELDNLESKYKGDLQKTDQYKQLKAAIIKRHDQELKADQEKVTQEQQAFEDEKKQIGSEATQLNQQIALSRIKDEKANLIAAQQFELMNLESHYDETLRKTDEYEALISATKARHIEERNRLEVEKAIESQQKQQEYYQAVGEIANKAGGAYSNLANQLKSATDEEAKQIKKAFLIQQAMAAGTAALNYYLQISSIETTAKKIDLACAPVIGMGEAYSIPAMSDATTQFGLTLAGIAAQTIGGVAAFHGGIDSVPNGLDNKSVFLKAGERVVAPKANVELSNFLAEQKKNGYSGGGQTITINAPLNTSGAIVDPKAFNAMLVKHRNTISAAVSKVNRERPTARGR